MSRHLDRINEQILNELGYLKTQRFEAEMFVIGFKPRVLTNLCVVVDRAAYTYRAFTLAIQRVRSSRERILLSSASFQFGLPQAVIQSNDSLDRM